MLKLSKSQFPRLLGVYVGQAVLVAATALLAHLSTHIESVAQAPGRAEPTAPTGYSPAVIPGGQEGQTEAVERELRTNYSLSVVLPAYNEEVAIAGTVHSVLAAVPTWTEDFEIIVVNDGSTDGTRAIVEEIARANPRVRLINHEVNQGCGAALVSGFEAVTKELVFFMDADGQFDIHDLAGFFPLLEHYDAVLGYRINRQDTWVRKLNAWGWNLLVRLVFKLPVRDVDCAFKLYRAQFFREHRLETRGAMINTEVLHKFRRAGYTYVEVGVGHLPRCGGKATGAKPSVIARAFHELFICAHKWYREERQLGVHMTQASGKAASR